MERHTVKLEYFKDNGTYYSEGDYLSEKQTMYEIVDEVRHMNLTKSLPGVTGRYKLIHVSSDASFAYPCMVVDS
jgi:hypothetical protein